MLDIRATTPLFVISSLFWLSCGATESPSGSSGDGGDLSTDGEKGSEAGSGNAGDTTTDTSMTADGGATFDGGSAGDGTDPESDTGTDAEIGGTCPAGYTKHITSSGRVLCCPRESPHFCDENELGFTGGCWSAEMDCSQIIYCGGEWWSCPAGMLSFCQNSGQVGCQRCDEGWARYETSSGKIICCGPDRPVYCDENDRGYGGGCWNDGVNCDTITSCGGTWLACLGNALVPVCTGDDFKCVRPPDGGV